MAGCTKCLGGLPSTIILSNQGLAGLGDRANVLLGAANLAASLCARLVVAPPSEMLSMNRHNQGLDIGSKVWWSRYFKFSGAHAVIYTGARGALRRWHPRAVVLTLGGKYNSTRHDVVLEYLAARAAKARGQEFTWQLNVRYHLWKDVISAKAQEYARPPLMPYGDHPHEKLAFQCSYVEMGLSDAVINTSRAVLATFGLTDGPPRSHTLAMLHVRRGKSTADPVPKKCNTSVAAVLRYMDCSVRAAFSPTTLLVATDETRALYLSTLTTRLAARYRSTQVVHVDPLIARLSPPWTTGRGVAHGAAATTMTTRPADNFFVYAVGRALLAASSQRLSVSFHACPRGQARCGLRHTCHPCNSTAGPLDEVRALTHSDSAALRPPPQWDAFEYLKQVLDSNAIHSSNEEPSVRLQRLDHSHRRHVESLRRAMQAGRDAWYRPGPPPQSWAQPRVFVAGPCEGTTWVAHVASTLLVLHGFPVHNASARDGTPPVLPEVDSLDKLRSSVEGAQKLGHTFVTKWSAHAPWSTVSASASRSSSSSSSGCGDCSSSSGCGDCSSSNSPVAEYLATVSAHVFFYHRTDLLARTVCMLRDFGTRRAHHALQRIGRLVDASTGEPVDITASQPAIYRRSLPSGAMPSVWVNASAFVAHLQKRAETYEERFQAAEAALRKASGTGGGPKPSLFIYEALAAVEQSPADNSEAMATSASAWMRLLHAWGVTADGGLVGRVLRALAGTRRRVATADVVYNWAELARVLRATPNYCRLVGEWSCEPGLSCLCRNHTK